MNLSDDELVILCSIIEQIVIYENDNNLSNDDYTDDDLFRDPPPKEDCPICMLPMPHASGVCEVRTSYMACCGKILCEGCVFATVRKWTRVK